MNFPFIRKTISVDGIFRFPLRCLVQRASKDTEKENRKRQENFQEQHYYPYLAEATNSQFSTRQNGDDAVVAPATAL